MQYYKKILKNFDKSIKQGDDYILHFGHHDIAYLNNPSMIASFYNLKR
jgi:hypothetical protein